MTTENKTTLLIESQYVGNIHYYARLLHHGKVLIEQCEHFQKATYRNRCHIAMPDGQLRLSIPLKRGRSQRQTMKDMKISYDEEWQKHHWNSLKSAYRSSPYFEYYEDDLLPIYTQKMVYLMDFNQHLNNFILTALHAQNLIEITFTEEFHKIYDSSKVIDFRSFIQPNPSKEKQDPLFETPVYHQVFETKTGFLPNLSVLDLLFSEGPNSLEILKNSIKIQ
ncbi:MAG: WbqC family protein [Chitinophagales bacterium]